MADWEEPLDSQTDPDAPITSQLGKRWDNNVVAMAEGAAGAPRVQGIALGGVSLGAIPLYIGDWSGFNNCGKVGLIVGHIAGNESTSYSKRIRFSTDNGATYGAAINLIAAPPYSYDSTGIFRIDLGTGVWSFCLARYNGSNNSYSRNGGTVSVPTGVNAFQIYGIAGWGDFYCLGGRT